MSDAKANGPALTADGMPLKRSLARALRMQKIRAFALILPLLAFVLVTFISPIADMLLRSVENRITSSTLPETVELLEGWDADSGEAPGEAVFAALYRDLFVAAESKVHTRLGGRLNYEQTGIASLFRTTGRKLDEFGEDSFKALEKLDRDWKTGERWFALMSAGDGAAAPASLIGDARRRLSALTGKSHSGEIGFTPGAEAAAALPRTARAYALFAVATAAGRGKDVSGAKPWESVKVALIQDLQDGADLSGHGGAHAEALRAAQQAVSDMPRISFRESFAEIDGDWISADVWRTIRAYSPTYTDGYFLNSIDMQKGAGGAEARPEGERIYITLFGRTLKMSLLITLACIALGYPVAWLLANLPVRTANLLLILVLLPFWTSLLVRTSAWKVMLQQQGVVNDVLVWLGMVSDAGRLVMINNQTGTIVAMTHILLPFMILPMYSVMQTIPPSYVRAAKSLGATEWTAFWRVYFPQSVPGIGAGSILVFILAIGYYITPEIVGGTTGTFISNRIAYHISSSLNWGLAAALGTILLAAVLILYWAYDRIVGVDNVKLG